MVLLSCPAGLEPVVLLPQSLKKLALQVCATTPGQPAMFLKAALCNMAGQEPHGVTGP